MHEAGSTTGELSQESMNDPGTAKGAAQDTAVETTCTKKFSKATLLLAAIIAAGFILRLIHIGNHGLFVDEVYSVLVSQGTADPELAQFDASRPVYFLLLKAWMLISSSETWMRLLSVIFGTANIALTYQAGKMMASRRVGLAAAVLVALSPMEIHYSQQVRMYTMGTTLVLLGTLSLMQAFATNSKKLIIAWAATRLLAVLTLPLTSMMLLVDGVYALVKRKEARLLIPMAVCTAVLLALWSPFVWLVLKAHASEYDSWRGTLDVPDLLDFFSLLINFTSTAVPLQESGGPPAFDYFTRAYVAVFPLVFYAGMIMAAINKKMRLCLACGMVPLILIFVWSNIETCLLITRYTMFTAPFIMLVAAYGWSQIWGKFKPLGFGAAGVYALAMTSCLNFFYTDPVHEDWRVVGNYLTKHVKPGDEIVVWNYHSQYLIGYYYKGKNRISDMHVVKEPEPGGDPEKPVVQLKFTDLNPKPGQRIWLVSRDAAPGWTRMFEVYGEYKEAIAKRFKVINHDHLVMIDIFEVVQP